LSSKVTTLSRRGKAEGWDGRNDGEDYALALLADGV
jgi:hypothetical protein